MNKYLIYIFIAAFLVASFFQGVRWNTFPIMDNTYWADQGFFVQSGNAQQFDASRAYGHPGGPIIEGEILIHTISSVSYDTALVIFLTLFNSLIIAFVCTLCFILRNDIGWSLVVLSTLSCNTLYHYSTPPTAVVSSLTVLLFLVTLYFFETKINSTLSIVIWSLTAGITIATRADIGVLSVLVSLIILSFVTPKKKLLTLLFGTIISFILFDPFMWYMPIQHILDLIKKVLYHYGEFLTPTHLSIPAVLSISTFAFISIFFSLVFIFYYKKEYEPLPKPYVVSLICMTFILYSIFLTARYQAIRYFQPIIFIWEVLLPIYILICTELIPFLFLMLS